MFGMAPKRTSNTISDLRTIAKMEYKGSNGRLNGIKVLIAENPNSKDDNKLEQVMAQFTANNCELTYSTYSNIVKTLESEQFNFKALIFIACTPVNSAKQSISAIQSYLSQKNRNKDIAIIVISGNTLQFVQLKNK
jgi:hypothetical protein